MPPSKKGGKSSASSATRKKQAAKAAKKAGVDPEAAVSAQNGGSAPPKGQQRGQKKEKKSKKEPKKKVFIPPPKPPQPPPDPLDSLGLASLLPSGLVVLLRKAAKKDVITRTRATEGLLSWIDGKDEEGESKAMTDEERETALILMLPCWVHIFPRLAASPTRKLRLLTAQIHARLLSPSLGTRSELLQSPQYRDPLIGPWSILAWDTDRLTALTARECWEGSVMWASQDQADETGQVPLAETLPDLANFFSSLLVHTSSGSGSTEASDVSAQIAAEGARDAKNRDEANLEEDINGVDARLAAGALGVLAWIITSYSEAQKCEELVNLLHATDVWAALYSNDPTARSAARTSVGVDYPITRTRAWNLLSALRSKQPELLQQLLHIVAPRALTAAWDELDLATQAAMLDALLPLLLEHNEIWAMNLRPESSRSEEDTDSESESEDDAPHPSKQTDATRSLAAFERWLQSGCGGNPRQRLPSVLVIVSTIPARVLPPTREGVSPFLDSFWASYESGLYDADKVARAEFFKSFAECSAHLIGKVSKSSINDAAQLSDEYLGRLWSADILSLGSSNSSRSTSTSPSTSKAQDAVDERMASTLRSLSRLDEDGSAAQPLLSSIHAHLMRVAQGESQCGSRELKRACRLLADLAVSDAPAALRGSVEETAQELAIACATSLSQGVNGSETTTSPATRLDFLAELLASFPGKAMQPATANFSEHVFGDYLLRSLVPVSSAGPYIAAYLRAASTSDGQKFLVALTKAASTTSDSVAKAHILQVLLDHMSIEALSQLNSGANSLMDDAALEIATGITRGDAAYGDALLGRLIDQPQALVEQSTADEAVALLVSRFHSLAREQVLGRKGDDRSLDRIRLIFCNWLRNKTDRVEHLVQINLFESMATAALSLAFLVHQPAKQSRDLWGMISLSPGAHEVALTTLREAVVDMQLEVAVALEGARRYIASAEPQEGQSLMGVVPTKEQLEGWLFSSSTHYPTPSSLSIVDPLVPLEEVYGRNQQQEFDVQGLSAIARAELAMLIALENNRNLARGQSWALPYLVHLAQACEDELNLSWGSGGILQANSTDVDAPQHLQRILGRTVRLSSNMLARLCDTLPEDWHAQTTEALRKNPGDAKGDPLQEVLGSLWALTGTQSSGLSVSSHLVRIFARLLTGVLSFSSAGEQEATRWLRLAASSESKKPELSAAIVFASKSLVYDTVFYDRQRNDIISRLASTPPTEANSTGMTLLRLACAIAPPAESSMELVPQQRAIFLLQGLQRWMASDEDLVDEINVRLAELFLHIVPLVQDVAGSHFDFFYDLIESNLEVASSLSEEPSLAALYQTLKLLELLNDLASRNALLREAATERQGPILELLEPIFKSLADDKQAVASVSPLSELSCTSVPRELTAELLVSVIRQQKGAFQSQDFSSLFCKLLKSPMREIQASSYRLLSTSIRAKVEQLVFESALEKEPEVFSRSPILLSPPELVDAIRKPIEADVEDLEEDALLRNRLMSFLLSWLAIFEHFEEASVELKSIYAAQIQRESLLATSLLPTTFALLEPQRTARRHRDSLTSGPFDPHRYAIDEIYLDMLEPTDLTSLRQLATHVYYRSLLYVPTQVRDWWLGIKDRQLSLGVSTFTSRHCSPLISARELSHLREPEALSRLQDSEAMSVKVIGSSEVVATYTVDEHPMEIAVRIPTDYPLHGVEVRDIRRVGVSEAQWRAWLLAVQQLISGGVGAGGGKGGGGGLVLNALLLFKRNAEAKFAGFEGAECAICYSIISPSDRSLPTKPCKTCNNKFHASCLYKWVTTSGASTCPLCRSIL